MADNRRPARRGAADTNSTDTDTAGQRPDEFTASDENDLLDEDDKEILKGRRPSLKDLDPEQLGK